MEEYLSDADVASRLHCSERHVKRLRAAGNAPPSIMLGRCRRTADRWIDPWLASHGA